MPEPASNKKMNLSLIWVPIGIAIGLVVVLLLVIYFQNIYPEAPLNDFDQMEVTDGFHPIRITSGQHWNLSYEQDHDREFTGIVRFISMDHETNFPIISFDILITSGDYSSPDLVTTSVANHHFTWMNLGKTSPQGTINLLHTVPMNQAIEDKLAAIKNGDTITIQGWDILKIDGYNKSGDYIGYWTDEGCNTTLVTDVTIQ